MYEIPETAQRYELPTYVAKKTIYGCGKL